MSHRGIWKRQFELYHFRILPLTFWFGSVRNSTLIVNRLFILSLSLPGAVSIPHNNIIRIILPKKSIKTNVENENGNPCSTHIDIKWFFVAIVPQYQYIYYGLVAIVFVLCVRSTKTFFSLLFWNVQFAVTNTFERISKSKWFRIEFFAQIIFSNTIQYCCQKLNFLLESGESDLWFFFTVVVPWI